MAGIFLSYRREDAGGHAGRLYDKLVERFGAEKVFRDIDTLRPGSIFSEYIVSAIASADVVIAMIGRDWISAADVEGRRRLDDVNDYVRLEIETALRRDVRVIPVLVRNATMPRADDLRDELAPLAQRHAFDLPDQHWPFAVDALIAALSEMVPQGEGVPARRSDAVRPSVSSTKAWEHAVTQIDVGRIEPPDNLEQLRTVCADIDDGRRPNETLVTVATSDAGVAKVLIIVTSRVVELHSIATFRKKGEFDYEAHHVIPLDNIRRARKLGKAFVTRLQLELKEPIKGPHEEDVFRVELMSLRPKGRLDEMLRYIQAKGG